MIKLLQSNNAQSSSTYIIKGYGDGRAWLPAKNENVSRESGGEGERRARSRVAKYNIRQAVLTVTGLPPLYLYIYI